MKLFPMPKILNFNDETVKLGNLTFIWKENADNRLFKMADSIKKEIKQTGNDLTVVVDYQDNDCSDMAFNNYQGYKINISSQQIDIYGNSAQGAFYGLVTLYQMVKSGAEISCGEITDEPDMIHRGFYYDVSRGRVPKVESLKSLVDLLAFSKCNSMQIYFEHTFDFREFKEINKDLGYMTAEEVKELDDYCYENFVELIPSLATIGHMYTVLQSEQYKHLCEYEIYTSLAHIWKERMLHHTIDVSNPESFELIKSLINQLMPLFRTSYFNLCGDETFDIAKGRNLGKDPNDCYVGFANKIIRFLKENGKKPMIWGDILNKSPEHLRQLEKGVIILNWNYCPTEDGISYEKFIDRLAIMGGDDFKQVIAPTTWTFNRLSAELKNSIANIDISLEAANKKGINAVLNTNWGDTGHLAALETCFFPLCYCAAKGWNIENFDIDEFSQSVSSLVYKSNENILPILYDIEKNETQIFSVWFAIFHFVCFLRGMGDKRIETIYTERQVEERISELKAVTQKLNNISMDEKIKSILLTAAKGNLIFYKLTLCNMTNTDTDEIFIELSEWFKEFKKQWLADNKSGEIYIIEHFMREIEVYLSIK